MKLTVKNNEKLIKYIIHNIQGISFGYAQKSLRKGDIKINNKRVKENIDVHTGDIIDIFISNKSKPNIQILYKDENILIVNKPQGIECATRDKSSENTYSVEELTEEYNTIVIHRLDRLTEGILILARNKPTAIRFEKYFRQNKIDRYYKAYIYGKLKSEGILKAYHKKDSFNALVEISNEPNEKYKEIITEIKTLKTNNKFSLVNIKLHTGKTHQIRSHLNFLGNPIINDNKYTNKLNFIETNYKGYFLTSYKIKFNLDDDFQYLNNLDIEITPSWQNEIFK